MLIRDIVDQLDRSWAYLSSKSGFDFATHMFAFFADLQREPRTAAILRDLDAEERDAAGTLADEETLVSAALLAIVNDLERDHPTLFPSAPDVDGYDGTAESIRRRLAPTTTGLAGEDPEDEDEVIVSESESDQRLDGALQILLGLVRGDDDVTQQRESIESLQRRIEHARRARRLAWESRAGAALARMNQHIRDLHPPPRTLPWKQEIMRHARVTSGRLKSVYQGLFGRNRTSDDADHAQTAWTLETFRADTQRVYEEVRRRLGTERSLRQVFERYRQRCQWYDAESLRALVTTTKKRSIEDALTETLAVYLFDHGLNPLVRPLFGTLLPDMVGNDDRFSFYVEAKQYKGASKRAYLRQGINQVWDMLNQTSGTIYEVREAFYVVFRLGGPRYAFPERLVHGRHTVFPLLVDIAPSDVRGSRASATIEIPAGEWAPKVADRAKPPRRARKPKRKPAARRRR